MFKSYPDVIRLDDQENDYDINWEEIARWAVEDGSADENPSKHCELADADAAAPIDWCKVADSFMREQVDEMDTDACDPSLLNSSINENRSVHLSGEKEYLKNNWQRIVADLEQDLPEKYWDTSRREKRYNYSQYQRRKRPESVRPTPYESSQSRRARGSSLFDESSEFSPPDISSREFSCLNNSFMQDTSSLPRSDILDYLATDYSNVRPHSIAEGYHFPGRAYESRVRRCDARAFTSTPQNRRSSLTESFEMVDGSKMFNITLEEILDIGRQLKHITNVRDSHGCEIINIERDINTDTQGVTHRKEKVRRYLESN